MIEKIIAVYVIKCKMSKMIYIGGTKDFHHRVRRHKSYLNRNHKQCNKYLLEDWNKYGEENFEFKILEKCNKENLLEREIYYTKLYKSNNRKYGYNIDCGNKERIVSEETRLKLSIANKGKKMSEESKLKMSISAKTRKKFTIS